MKTPKVRSIKEEIWLIYQIYMNAQQALRIVKEIVWPDNNLNRDFVKNHNQFLQYTSIICWRNCVTETCKLVVDRNSEHYNLWQLNRDIYKGSVFADVTFEVKMLIKWRLALVSRRSIIRNLKEQRDKLYAHTDRDIRDIGNQVKIGEMEEMLNTIFDIIHDLYDVCRSESILQELTNSPVDDLDWILEALTLRDKYYEELEKSLDITS